jgi:hypothetical protein
MVIQKWVAHLVQKKHLKNIWALYMQNAKEGKSVWEQLEEDFSTSLDDLDLKVNDIKWKNT